MDKDRRVVQHPEVVVSVQCDVVSAAAGLQTGHLARHGWPADMACVCVLLHCQPIVPCVAPLPTHLQPPSEEHEPIPTGHHYAAPEVSGHVYDQHQLSRLNTVAASRPTPSTYRTQTQMQTNQVEEWKPHPYAEVGVGRKESLKGDDLPEQHTRDDADKK